MVSKIIWAPRALEDLRRIATYIGKSSPIRAERFCLRLIVHVETLEAFPLKGRIIPERNQEKLRELVFPPYRIAYEVRPDSVIVVLSIWHSARGPIDL
ncbi:addiction module toxin, RelE/StbE family [Opitutaceae bacterium TAV1]|nr:addiction module toxin, RelE/StbE family [Opitutaceae bacterium TAV1]